MRKLMLILSVLLLLAAQTRAQGPFGPGGGQTGAPPLSNDKGEDEGVSISFSPFLRAHKDNPAEQLDHALALLEKGDKKDARKQFRAVLKYWPASREAALAQYHFAVLTLDRGKETRAAREFEYLLQTYAGEFPQNNVLGRLYVIGKHFMDNKKAKFLFGGFEAPERALPLFETIVQYGPEWEGAAEAQYLIGAIHQQLDQHFAAVHAFEKARAHYPDTVWARKAAFGMAKSRYEIAKDQPNAENALREAWADLTAFVQTYPDAEEVPQAEQYRDRLLRRWALINFERAVFYERMPNRPQAALRAYREFVKKFPSSEWTPEAQKRIQALAVKVEKIEALAEAEAESKSESEPEPTPGLELEPEAEERSAS